MTEEDVSENSEELGWRHWAVVLITVLALTPLGIWVTGGFSQDEPVDDSLITFHEEPLVDLATGEEFTLEEFVGRPILLNFFASWCPQCITEMPELQQVQETYGDQLVIIGLAVDDLPEDSLRLVESTGVTYYTATDPDRWLVDQVQPLGFPHNLFIDQDGFIFIDETGAVDFEIIQAAISEALPELVALEQ